MAKKKPLDEDRLIAILATLPVPIHVYREDDLYHWEAEPAGKGAAAAFEEAFDQALTYTLSQAKIPQQVTLLRPEQARYGMTLEERLAVPVNGDDPATWPIDGQWPDAVY